MTQILARVAMAAIFAAGMLSATVAPAAAQDVDIYFGGRPPPPPPPGYGRPPPPPPGYYPPPPGYGYNRPPPPPPPPGYGRRGCNPQMAEDIARDYGFRRARVAQITPRRVIVQGFTRRGPDQITFANVRGCPVLR